MGLLHSRQLDFFACWLLVVMASLTGESFLTRCIEQVQICDRLSRIGGYQSRTQEAHCDPEKDQAF